MYGLKPVPFVYRFCLRFRPGSCRFPKSGTDGRSPRNYGYRSALVFLNPQPQDSNSAISSAFSSRIKLFSAPIIASAS
jgi:hypothetical protein